MIAEALDHPKTTSMSWLVPRTPHEHFVSLQNYDPHVVVISADLQDGPFKGLKRSRSMMPRNQGGSHHVDQFDPT